MLFTIPNAIIQNPRKRKMIGPGNAIKVKPLVDTIPAIAIRVPLTINKIDTKVERSFIETRNAAVASATAPKPKIIPLTIVLSPKNWPPAAFVTASILEIRNRMSAAMANPFAILAVKISLSAYLDIATSICGICIFFEPVTAPTIPASTLGTAVIAMTCQRVAYMLGKISSIDKLG
jgi:hypothetical protein